MIIIVLIGFSVLIGFCVTYLISLTKNAQKQEKELLRLMDELDTSVIVYSLLRDRAEEAPMTTSAKADVVSDWEQLDIFLLTYWNQEKANILRGKIRKVLYEEGGIATNLHIE